MHIQRGTTHPSCSVATALALALGLLAVATPATAQGGVRLIPQVGLYVPLRDLGTVGSGGNAVDVARKESTLGLGLSVEFAARQRVSFRVNGVYGTESGVPIGDIGCTACEARSTVTVLTGSVVARPIPNLLIIQPYLQAGAGIKRYDFDDDAARQEGFGAFVSDQNVFTGQLGLGLELNVGLGRLLFELSDFISGVELGSDQLSGDSKLQHDMFLTIGFAIGG